MDRFLIKKRKLSEELPDPYNAHGVDVEELPGPSFNLPNVEVSASKNTNVRSKNIIRQYHEYYHLVSRRVVEKSLYLMPHV